MVIQVILGKVSHNRHFYWYTVQLVLVNGVACGSAPIELLPWRQTFYGMDIGSDQGSTVSDAYPAPFRFEGRLHHVDYELDNDRNDLRKAAAMEARNAVADQ